ncbi:MAG: YvcK family protein [Lactobacillaceae bacterium]|jgi:uncharacterized cofD-like protein|nr:YvcK family protein [Lactobacillaceae bacterium]
MVDKKNKKRIVVIGGGSGLPVILRPLRDLYVEVTAIVTVADNGGSSGIIRDYMNIIPPGDIRNALAALSRMDEDTLKIFQHRFESSDEFFQNHALGNLIIAAMSEVFNGDIYKAIKKLSDFLLVDGHVLPVSESALTLHAKFNDGLEISGEHEITASHKVIDHIWVTKEDGSEAMAAGEVLNAIMSADLIVFGPGSLYTSILPNLVIPGVTQAIEKTKAKTVYISNIMTQKGETDDFSDADHITAINKNVGTNIVDYVITNTKEVNEKNVDFIKNDEISHQVFPNLNAVARMGIKQITGDFLLEENGGAYHDGKKIAKKLIEIIGQ